LNDAASIKDWLGRTRRDEDEIALGAVQRLAATLDQDPTAFKRGSALPESWYAILFGTIAPESDLGPDGHPVTGDFMPPMRGTRRMFAGRRTTFHRPLQVGDTVTRLSTISRAEPKTGRTGAFTLVTVTHEMSGPSGLAITEEQDLVYRAAVEAGTTEAPKEAPRVEDKPDWSRPTALDTVLLFRYSALTFNAHRIHYDLPYTRDVEGYPALVMTAASPRCCWWKPRGRICRALSPPMRRARSGPCSSANASPSTDGRRAAPRRCGRRVPMAGSTTASR
jgi:3-methylfumaryl-CoA hydratase